MNALTQFRQPLRLEVLDEFALRRPFLAEGICKRCGGQQRGCLIRNHRVKAHQTEQVTEHWLNVCLVCHLQACLLLCQ